MISPRPRPRVLLSAYACGPERGSEPGVGWQRALQTARFCDTWVLCEQRNTADEAMERYFSRNGAIPGLTFVKIPRSSWQESLYRIPGGFYRGYNLWQKQALKAAKQLHAEMRFDLVHHLNYCGFREPGYLWQLNAPFVWGPVGGTQNFPASFLGSCGLAGAMREGLRGLINRLQLKTSRRVRQAARRAALVIAANHSIKNDLDRQFGIQSVVQLETGVSDEVFSQTVKTHPAVTAKLKILWSGTLGHHKALPILLAALAKLPLSVPYELRVLGRGPLEGAWKRLACSLNVPVQWLGHVPHHQAMQQFAWADLFAFTSLRDTTGTVVIEALASGTPVICFDHQGAGEVVNDSCGIKIPAGNPAQAVNDFAASLEHVHHNREYLDQLASNAVARTEAFRWQTLGDEMARLYARVLEEHGYEGDSSFRHAGGKHGVEACSITCGGGVNVA